MRRLIILLLATGMVRNSAGGYLATVGPVNIRFQPSTKVRAALPPLRLDNSPSAPGAEATTSGKVEEPFSILSETMDLKAFKLDLTPAADSGVRAPLATLTSSESEKEAPASASPFVPGFTSSTNSIVTSQSLLQLYNTTARPGPKTTVVIPMQFVPGAPPSRGASSTATYGVSERK